jgi:hypothetical protein
MRADKLAAATGMTFVDVEAKIAGIIRDTLG